MIGKNHINKYNQKTMFWYITSKEGYQLTIKHDK